jgi:hypothetical protein
MQKPVVVVHHQLTDGEFAEAMKGMPSQFYSRALKIFHAFALHEQGVTWSFYCKETLVRAITLEKVRELLDELERRLDDMLASNLDAPHPRTFFEEAALAAFRSQPGANVFRTTSMARALMAPNIFTPQAEGGFEMRN